MASHISPAPVKTGLGGEFHKLWAASGISNLGDGVWLVAAPLTAATLTRDPVLIAGLSFTQRVPWLIFPLLSGALADRIDRRKAMVGVTLIRAALVFALGVAVMTDRINLPFLYIAFFLLTTGETLFDTSSTALIPDIVPREQLTTANACLSGMVMVTNLFLGRPLGEFLFARLASLPFTVGAAGLASPFWFSTIAALILLVFVWPVYTDRTVAEARKAAQELA